MVADDDDWDEWEPPPDPSIRAWRHPSELAAAAAEAQAAAERHRRFRSRGLVTAGVLVGAGICLIGVAALRFSSQTDAQLVFGSIGTTIPEAGAAVISPTISLGDMTATTTAAASSVPTTQPDSASSVAVSSAPTQPMPAGVVTVSDGTGPGNVLANGLAIDGIVITSASILGETTSFTISQDSAQVSGELLATDSFSDIAVISYDSAGGDRLVELPVADPSKPLAVGTEISLHGADTNGKGRTTSGALIAMDQTIRSAEGHDLVGSVETTAELEPLLPGALLSTSSGEAVGIVVNCDNYLAAAIPLSDARSIANLLVQYGWATDTWLGVQGVLVDEGIKITEVAEGSPAQAAELAEDDTIARFDDEDLDSITDLVGKLRQHSPGDVVELTVERDGDRHAVMATLGQRSLSPDAR